MYVQAFSLNQGLSFKKWISYLLAFEIEIRLAKNEFSFDFMFFISLSMRELLIKYIRNLPFFLLVNTCYLVFVCTYIFSKIHHSPLSFLGKTLKPWTILRTNEAKNLLMSRIISVFTYSWNKSIVVYFLPRCKITSAMNETGGAKKKKLFDTF